MIKDCFIDSEDKRYHTQLQCFPLFRQMRRNFVSAFPLVKSPQQKLGIRRHYGLKMRQTTVGAKKVHNPEVSRSL